MKSKDLVGKIMGIFLSKIKKEKRIEVEIASCYQGLIKENSNLMNLNIVFLIKKEKTMRCTKWVIKAYDGIVTYRLFGSNGGKVREIK